MIKPAILFGCLLSFGDYLAAEETSTLDRLKTLSQESITKLKETSKYSTENNVAGYADPSYSYTLAINCNTQAHTQGHKFVTGVGCHIDYKFAAKKNYQQTELSGNLLPTIAEDDCDKAIAICKSAHFSFKEIENNRVDIIHQDKIIGTVDFSNDIIGFTPK